MKFILLTHYTEIAGVPPSDEWAAADAEAHMAYLEALNKELADNRELVSMIAAAPPAEAVVVRAVDEASPDLRRGASALGSDPLAGLQVVEVVSLDRAIKVAARVSAAPGPEGRPLGQPIEVRSVAGEFDPSEQ
jgi:hypothetical protein